MADPCIGERDFTGGSTRPVYRDEQGQYVLDDGQKVYGFWPPWELEEADEPVIVQAQRSRPTDER